MAMEGDLSSSAGWVRIRAYRTTQSCDALAKGGIHNWLDGGVVPLSSSRAGTIPGCLTELSR